jgi:hypothetical protein
MPDNVLTLIVKSSTTSSCLAAIATILIAGFVAYIAWQQWRVAKHKLRLDLFDRRYKVFEATRKFLVDIARESTFSNKQLFMFHAGTSDAKFLFDDAVADYLEEIRKRASMMRAQREIYTPLPVGDERTASIQIETDHFSWLADQLMDSNIAKIFTPYLDFSLVK